MFVDDQSVYIPAGSAVIQACEKAGREIPRFCYHERLAVAGNCRMCLVEVERTPKPVASCAMPVMPGMRIHTDTPMVKKAREGVMEFLLANHPLDCPICDQGGECDLQDQAVRYGSDRSRLSEIAGKRAVQNKNFGPIVKTTMTRCIHCTRCVRFANEVAGVEELGTSGRGNAMEIGTYVSKMLDSEMSGNIVDLCPVGALTAKPYSFLARPWELKKTESVDTLDAMGSNIRVDSRGVEVLRVLPRLHEGINEEWLSDKSRFACDGLKRQRLTTPLVRDRITKLFKPVSWPEALDIVSAKLTTTDASLLAAVAGQQADAESLVLLKDLYNKLGSENLTLESMCMEQPGFSADLRASYLLNSGIAPIETADVVLLIGTNPRHEAAIFNTRLRKAYLNGTDFGLIGKLPKLNYEVEHLGDSFAALSNFFSTPFGKKFKAAKRPAVIIGSSVLTSEDGAAWVAQLGELARAVPALIQEDFCGISILAREASFAGAMDIGFRPNSLTSKKPAKFVYLLGADAADLSAIAEPGAFVVYQGHHGDAGAHAADVVLPGAAYTEKDATFVNGEGRAQRTTAAVSPPGAAREDWSIIRAISAVSGVDLPYDTLDEVRSRMADVSPTLTDYDSVATSLFSKLAWSTAPIADSKKKKVSTKALDLPIKDFYMTDTISRASTTMAHCSAAFTAGSPFAQDKAIKSSLTGEQPC